MDDGLGPEDRHPVELLVDTDVSHAEIVEVDAQDADITYTIEPPIV